MTKMLFEMDQAGKKLIIKSTESSYEIRKYRSLEEICVTYFRVVRRCILCIRARIVTRQRKQAYFVTGWKLEGHLE